MLRSNEMILNNLIISKTFIKYIRIFAYKETDYKRYK